MPFSELFSLYLAGAGVILFLVTALWLLSLALRDSSIVDIFWGAGFVISAWVYFALAPNGLLERKLLIAALATIWGLRLSIHLLLRNWGRGEDFRYQAWRREAGPSWWWRSYFKVFLLQGFLMWLISAPLLAAQVSPSPSSLGWLDALGVLLWAVGFFFEAVGDWQLRRFRQDPANKGRLLTTGIWRYTRHPNYFGDAVQWWAFFLVALAAGGWWSFYSPVIMTFLLRSVSGVAMLEKTLANTKPGFQEYVAATNAFIPWFPRKPSRG